MADDEAEMGSWDEDEEYQSSPSVGLTFRQKATNLASRLLHDRACSLFYVGMLALNVFLIGWVVFARGYPDHWLFALLEIGVNVALAGEVLLRLVAQQRRFFNSKSNWFDLVVTIMCMVSLGLYFGGPSTMEEIDDALASFLLIFRYGVQFLRLMLFVKNNQRKLTSPASIDIVLPDDDDEDAFLHDATPDESSDTVYVANGDYSESEVRYSPLSVNQ